jgi:phospholipase D1/2
LLNGDQLDGWFDIKKKSGKKRGQLKLKVLFLTRQSLEKTYDVECYFPMHSNCRVTLYQDAHVPPNMDVFNNMHIPPGESYYPQSCWKDLYYSLMNAKEMICITGWAVWDKLHLFRGAELGIDRRTLGEILRDKAREGVKVYIMVWSEKTSNEFKKQGVMGTHDMDTYFYFKQVENVTCVIAPRELGDVKELTDALQNQFSSGAYTHHQKSVICDADPCVPGSQRRLIAFVGGLDLTGGRYDTPNHELYKTLLDEHNGDFRNSNAKVVSANQGPREPWHDIHSKVEGTIAFDVFENFWERWQQQGLDEGEMIHVRDTSVDICAPLDMDPQKSWNVQFFRSITSDSAVFDEERVKQHMNSKKGRQVDSSIAQAYIQIIRNAENFIFIENQYFLGSAYSWLQNDDTNCHHTIPVEIAQKVVDKILAGQRFTAYIMIPMFPEGDPASMPIQEILFWQTRTIEMMYKRVGDALQATGNTTHPTDWLLFLCPGKREAAGDHLERLEPPSEPMAETFRRTLRFPIYVHSKMIIVDDAYILVGSANINQRSMAGTRDTEMAVGCWQPAYPDNHPYGDVHMFRMSLWAAHFQTTIHEFVHPGSNECVHKVKEMAWHNWQQYIGPDGSTTPGKILFYPLDVQQDGSIKTWPDYPEFPDFPPGSKIMGQVSSMIPQKVTT